MLRPKASLPTAVLLSAVVFASRAPDPTATLLLPVVLDTKATYPIASLTWILAEPGYKSEEIKTMLRYMLGDKAQTKADSLGYVPLPPELKQKSLEAVESL